MAWKPQPLMPGDAVAVIAPAKFVAPEEIEAGIDCVERRGYQVLLAPHLFERDGLFSADDAKRLEDLLWAWRSPAKAVLCARGGYGSQRLLAQMPWRFISATPKWLVGYSDITALHCGFLRRQMVVVHGPVLSQLGRTDDDRYGENSLFAILEGSGRGVLTCAEPNPILWGSGKVTGRLVGGNLSLLCALLGTPEEIDARGAILLLEDVEEEPYRLDRMLSQLYLAGKLQAAVGIAIGTFTGCLPSDWAPDITATDVVVDWLKRVQKPALMGLPIGHGTYNSAVVLGSRATLDLEQRSLSFIL
ncbi:MAG TPA: LD-carboxypeptidase [Firmicutes bacterium]|nr:LD-carboxypeptidase [Bacillota bacterium]